ncbi:type II toxin-antitoxin system RatA family toxin [Inmirania thermothiophila]|uniref:Ribosome-associated toxin RatA of RatAB toxin-antitoxin module n=1 Tax=Inmirania thermothiophila TaxID=1750597 RepID=A0A3N1Y0M7_9GAMM|nr:type II toxin-antitoxin system RatA family toxin [Inmirania thermothiophila]ROR32071.1 ribosome-associated toxin RatA of RatAB toxin-antitoxin module [Inmirania thermothiophila]
MPVIHREARVPYTPRQMFELVNDVEAYPRFLPWCGGARVLRDEGDAVWATVVIARGSLRKAFTTVNRVQPGKMIEIRLVEGPFRRLEGFWRFDEAAGGGCRVCLDLEFEFAGRVVSLALGPVFHQIAQTLVEAFCRRAEEVYGRG